MIRSLFFSSCEFSTPKPIVPFKPEMNAARLSLEKWARFCIECSFLKILSSGILTSIGARCTREEITLLVATSSFKCGEPVLLSLLGKDENIRSRSESP
eukprot:Gb_27829 [translate_table: standard]